LHIEIIKEGCGSDEKADWLFGIPKYLCTMRKAIFLNYPDVKISRSDNESPLLIPSLETGFINLLNLKSKNPNKMNWICIEISLGKVAKIISSSI
jgi:hypothetical protein